MSKLRGQICPKCNEYSDERNDEFDAYYCPKCVIWLEEGCDDPECFYCPQRPPTPPKP